MADTRRIEVPLACPHYTISVSMMITSVVIFIGTLAMKYEFFIIFGDYSGDYIGKPIVFLLAGSVLIFADSCFGLVALAHRWYHSIIAFLACAAYLLVTMIVLVAVTYFYSLTTEEAMFLRLEESMKNEGPNSEIVAAVQLQLDCCGYNNFSDWTINYPMNIPQSCCIGDVLCDPTSPSEIHSSGCHDALHAFLYFHKWIIVIVLAVLGVTEVISIVLSVIVLRDLPREIPITEASAIGNNGQSSTTLPRIHNPLGQDLVPTSGNSERAQDPYVRRPSQRPAVLTYRNPHENFLTQPPQLRYDRRIMLPSTKHQNQYAVRPG